MNTNTVRLRGVRRGIGRPTPHSGGGTAAATDEPRHRFIQAWARMGAGWGINRSTAAVHALLLTSPEAVSLDAIAETLGISRGNASTCLKELRNWGVVRKESQPGDRKDYFATDDDMWAMFINIARERKRREFDPAVRAVRQLLAEWAHPVTRSSGRGRRTGQGPAADVTRRRLQEMDAFLGGLERLASGILHQSDAPGLLEKLTGVALGLVGARRRR
jgi:DNA-binding transcriptional regulator GbsR (MarR family)